MLDAAKSWATQQAELFKQQLGDMYGNLSNIQTENVNSANLRRDSLMNSINANLGKVENQYQKDARGAYVNKMQSGKQLQGLLSRMNLGSSGFGVGQEMGIESAYGQNLTGLQEARNMQVGDLNLQGTNVGLEHNAQLGDINAAYLGKVGQMDQYVADRYTDAYNTAYNQYVSDQQYQEAMKQQKLENEMAAKKYADALKQQTFSNDMEVKRYNLSKRTSGGSGAPKTPAAAAPVDTKNFTKNAKSWLSYYGGISDPNELMSVLTGKGSNYLTTKDREQILKYFGL